MHFSRFLSVFGRFMFGAVLASCSDGGTQQGETVRVVPAGAGGNPAAGGNTGIPVVGTAGGASVGTGGSAGAGVGPTGGSSGAGGVAGSPAAGGSGGSGGASEPEGKIVLFDGSDATFKEWKARNNGQDNPWQNNGDGSMTVKSNTGDIISKQGFQDVFLHLEYKTPKITSAGGGQERGNSGVYLKSSYEMQVLDTYGLAPMIDGCGALYSIAPPLVVACNKEDEWNTYEIEFKANVCNNGQKSANAKFVEVKLNGQLVQQNVEADHTTQAGLDESCDPQGVLLQDHSSILPVSFRNIWVIPRN